MQSAVDDVSLFAALLRFRRDSRSQSDLCSALTLKFGNILVDLTGYIAEAMAKQQTASKKRTADVRSRSGVLCVPVLQPCDSVDVDHRASFAERYQQGS